MHATDEYNVISDLYLTFIIYI